jgi:hypothetical protein
MSQRNRNGIQSINTSMANKTPSRINLWANFWTSLSAILIGNAVYFLLVSPNIPVAGRHRDFAIDIGLVIDFWVCLVVYGLIRLVLQRKNAGKPAD